jgi:hypothetical protein
LIGDGSSDWGSVVVVHDNRLVVVVVMVMLIVERRVSSTVVVMMGMGSIVSSGRGTATSQAGEAASS